ncbi:MAG: transcriptional regulator with XRE-family HTH domain [Cryomorphaceae bacterium]|jgi:transcriptional regulator with XRE-family HTH domain
MTEKFVNQQRQFGNYLRFWRTTKDISQEHLAHELDCSVKHISFLENGKTQPSQALILRSAETLDLSKVDTNNLLISAGYRAEHDFLENHPEEKILLEQSLALMLENIGSSPALIRDRFGNIKMMNKACVVIWREWLGDAMDDPALMNTYRIFFSNRGWRPFVESWSQIAVILLMNLNQERLLSPNDEADKLIEELSDVYSSSEDWEKHSSTHTKRSSFPISMHNPKTNIQSSSLVCASTIGNLSQSVDASLCLEVHCRIDRESPYTAVEIANMQNVTHPLLPY